MTNNITGDGKQGLGTNGLRKEKLSRQFAVDTPQASDSPRMMLGKEGVEEGEPMGRPL